MRRLLSLILLLGFSIFVSQKSAAQCWKLQTPAFPHESTNSIYFTNENNGFLAVNAGIIGRTTDGGYTWIPIETPSYENLRAITTASKLDVWCGGDRGALLHSTDGGFQWSQVNFNDSISIQSISFPTQDTGFFAGDSCIFRTTDGGNTWSRQSFPPLSWQDRIIGYIQFFNKDTGYAHRFGKLFKTYNGGGTWTAYPISGFYMISFATNKIGYAVADSLDYDNYYKTINGGASWFKVNTVLNYNQGRGGFYVLDSMHVYVLDDGVGIGNTRIYYTSDGGQSWQNNNYIPQIHWSSAIFFTSPTTGHVADLWGSCKKTYDKGATWATLANDYTGSGETIFELDSLRIWQAGNAFQKRTSDGGKTWVYSVTNSAGMWLDKLQFKSTTKGYALTNDYNYNFYVTTDGGQNWLPGYSAGKINDFAFASLNFGIVAKNGKLARTYDGGQTWTTLTFPSNYLFTKIACSDSLHWYASCSDSNNVTYNTMLYHSSDGGITWIAGAGLDWPVTSLDAVKNSNMVCYTANSTVIYRSTDGGQTFQIWSGNPSALSNGMNRISAATPDKAFAIDLSVVVGPQLSNSSRLFISTPAGWQISLIHSSFTYAGIHYPDSTRAWLTTSFGTIYRYYAAGTCPPDILAPFLDLNELKGCAGSSATVQVANYLSYSSPYDTLKAQLLSGNNIIWNGVPDSNGQIVVPIPSASGTYLLKVIVSNPQIPDGRSTAIPVTPLFSYNAPSLNFWRTQCNSGCCAGTQIQIGISSTSNLGVGYTYELHKLNKDGIDSIVAVNQMNTTLYNASDTFKLYYKVNLGANICYPQSAYFSDTVTFNINQPQAVTATLSSTATKGQFCFFTPLTFIAQASATGVTGQSYQFFKLTPFGPQLLGSGPTNMLTLPASTINNPTSVYCQVFPGYGGCLLLDTVVTDTVTVQPIDTIRPGISSNWGTDSFCQGKPIAVNIDTSLTPGFNHWELWKINNGSSNFITIGTGNGVTDTAVQPNTSYFFKVFLPTSCIVSSDTLYPHVIPAQKAGIHLAANGNLSATPINAVSYDWFQNGTYYINTSSPILANPPAGTYYVSVVTPDSCMWLPSDPYTVFANSSVENLVNANQWAVYPNPNQGNLWIKGLIHSASLGIYDLTGREINRTEINANQKQPIDITHLPSGTYFISISSDQLTKWFQITVIRP